MNRVCSASKLSLVRGRTAAGFPPQVYPLVPALKTIFSLICNCPESTRVISGLLRATGAGNLPECLGNSFPLPVAGFVELKIAHMQSHTLRRIFPWSTRPTFDTHSFHYIILALLPGLRNQLTWTAKN